jgi:LysM repeat protein
MLELVKQNIHMNRFKSNVATQVTLDDDFIVPDTMDDMARIILSSGDIQIESVKNQSERVLVKGKLNFQVLYRKAEGGLQTMAGSISFEEPVNVSGLEEKDYLGVSWDLEDLTAGMINSRKISVKAIVTLVVRVEALYDAEAAVDVVETGTGSQNTGGWGSGRDDGGWNPGRDSGWGAGRDNGGWNQERDDSGWNSGRDDNGWNGGGSDDSGVWDGGARNWETGAGLKSREGSAAGDGDKDVNDRVADMEILRRQADVAVIAVRRKDTYRIKEDISLSGSKPSIEQILWNEIRLRGVTTKPLDGRVHIEGEVMIFAIYTGEGESAPIQWLEESIPFAGEVDLPEAVEGMVPSISVRLVHRELEAKPDYDGEMRDLELDAVLELDMKLYEEKKIELLGDFYSNDRELELESGEVCFDRLLSKNTGKCRIAEKLDLNSSDRILQICHNDGTIKIDDIEIKDESLHIDGVLEVSLLYLTSDDGEPVKAETEAVPFHYEAEAPGITSDSVYQLNTGLEQMTAVMAGGGTVEVKAVLNLDILVLQPVKEPVILGVKEMPLDLEKLQELPGITGYIVQPGDCLWDIAKRFHTTRKQVMESNGLSGDQIKPGDRLILVKEIAGA